MENGIKDLDHLTGQQGKEAIIGAILNNPGLINKYNIKDNLFNDDDRDIDARFYKKALPVILMYYKDDGELDTFVVAKHIENAGKEELAIDDQINISKMRLDGFKEKHTETNIKAIVSHYKLKLDASRIKKAVDAIENSLKVNPPDVVVNDFRRFFSEVKLESEYDEAANDYSQAFEEIAEDAKMLEKKEFQLGVHFIDSFIISLLPKRQLLIVADAGSGKTRLCLKMSKYLTANNVPVVFFSLEMPTKEMIKIITDLAMIHPTTGVQMSREERSATYIENPKALAENFNKNLTKGNLFIYDKSGTTVEDMIAYIEQIKKQTGRTPMVIIDSFTNIVYSGSIESSVDLDNKVSMQLVNFKKSSNIPLIVIHHLNKDKILRGSQKIEDNTDFIMYMKFATDEEKEVNLSWGQKARFWEGSKIKTHLIPSQGLKELDGWVEAPKPKKKSIF